MDEIPASRWAHDASTHAAEQRITAVVEDAIRANVAPAVSLYVHGPDGAAIRSQWGWLDPAARAPLQDVALFDLASVTKLFTVTTFLRQVSEGKTSLDAPVASVLPEFAAIAPRAVVDSYEPQSRTIIPMPPEYAGRHIDPTEVTFRHLLTHTSGLPPWRKTYKLAAPTPPPPPHITDPVPRSMRWARVFGALCALDFVGVPGDRVRYTDIGLMLLGEAVARLDGRGLAEAIRHTLSGTGASDVTFCPVANGVPYAQTIPTEEDPEWRGRRVHGEVHDENACGAGGVAGHAGLFGTAEQVAMLGVAWLRHHPALGINAALMDEAVREHAETDGMRRGLGWMLKAYDNASCGDLFSDDSYGHTGFTGTSLWVDPQRGIVVALLTNRVYRGRDFTGIHDLRRAVHTIIAETLR